MIMAALLSLTLILEKAISEAEPIKKNQDKAGRSFI